MGRTAKNRACAVIHQYEIGNMNRQFDRRIKWMANLQSGIKAFFLGCFNSGFRCAKFGTFSDEIGCRWNIFANRQRQGVIGSDGQK